METTRFTVELTGQELAALKETVKYGKLHVGSEQITPPEVRAENLATLDSIARKLSQAKKVEV